MRTAGPAAVRSGYALFPLSEHPYAAAPADAVSITQEKVIRPAGKVWRAPSERIRTASEIPIEVNLTDEGAVPVYMKISEKVLHLRRLGMAYATIAERLKINLWMAKRAARWGKTHLKRRENTSPY